ncbi:MAG: PLP-dependent aminotransferase family protein [Rhodospirillales bacterium]
MIEIVLDPTDTSALYQQIADRVRVAAIAGTIAPGTRLPSSRALSARLGVARGTVDAAYAVLAGEGAVETRGASGTIVSRQFGARPDGPVQRTLFATPEKTIAPAPAPLPFRMGLPGMDVFPRKLWSGLSVGIARALQPNDFGYPDPAGYWPLRQAIAAYLRVSRGIGCRPEQVIVTAGFQGALALVRRALLRPGDAVWVEDPGYTQARQALEAGGQKLVPVRVDRDGIRVAAGIAAAPKARLALVTPTHQYPLGVALSLPRRLALLAWAAESGAWILEDDYDSEFRYTGHNLPALKSLDRTDRVLFAGSFSKVLHPSLRLGYLVVPEELTDAFQRASRLLTAGQATLEQRIVAALIDRGHFARHLRRMRGLYAERRAALATALTDVLGKRVEIGLESGGMHLLARFPGADNDGELVRRATAAELAPMALSSLTMAHDCGQGLLLNFANLPVETTNEAVRRLAAAIGS